MIFYFHLSGELPSNGIPANEVIAIIKAVNAEIKETQVYDKILVVTTNTDISKQVAERAAYIHRCGKVIFIISLPDLNLINKKLQEIDFNQIMKKKTSFAVRIKKIKGSYLSISEENLERYIGNQIINNLDRNIKVNLINPSILFYGFVTEENFIFGINLYSGKRPEIRKRAPHTRPFFHPCGLDPFLARAMVNLSEMDRSKTLYDPFCGSGSILIESKLMGFKTYGSDINQKMLKGTILNLRALNIQGFNLFRADARSPCIQKIDCIVTDPPYGRSTHIELGKLTFNNTKSLSNLYRTLKNLLVDFFRKNSEILTRGGKCVIALPSTLEIDNIILSHNFIIQQKFDFFVHRSLTRTIFILEKV